MDVQCEPNVLSSLCSNVLFVEDSIIIAMDAEALLNDMGADRVNLVSGVKAAMLAIDQALPSIAILDVKLQGETSFPIADRLQDLHVPYIFATGYSDRSVFPERHKHVPCMSKPFDSESLRHILEEVASAFQFDIQSAQRTA